MFIVSNVVGSTIQITTLPLPVLSTLQASGLVFNSICASLILGEPFTRWSLGGTILVSSGAVLIAVFGAIPESAHSLDQLLVLLGRGPFVAWMICQALLVVAIIVIASFLSSLAISSTPKIRLWRGLAYGGVSGILSAHSLLVAKSAVELLVRTIVDRVNQFNRWQSWIIVLGLITLALTQLYFLHRGLKLVTTSVLYPLVFCVYNIIAILDGLIYFNQADQLPALHAGLIALGTAILLSGVLALSWRLSDEQSQPAVAQSVLAPGAGFAEDTDSSDHEDNPLLGGEPLTPNGKDATWRTPRRRETEEDEIWGELHDRLPNERHSFDTPDEGTNLLLPRANTSGGLSRNLSGGLARSATMGTGQRRRRRSTGFPGFIARPARRKESVEGWRMKWLPRWVPDNKPDGGSGPDAGSAV